MMHVCPNFQHINIANDQKRWLLMGVAQDGITIKEGCVQGLPMNKVSPSAMNP
jgi:hypothetical protein